jgi:hypothetical protein
MKTGVNTRALVEELQRLEVHLNHRRKSKWPGEWYTEYCPGSGRYAGREMWIVAPVPVAMLIHMPYHHETGGGEELLRVLKTARRVGIGLNEPLKVEWSNLVRHTDPAIGERECGWTLLHWAADMQSHALIAGLLECGLDPHQQDAHGLTPVDVARVAGHKIHLATFSAWAARQAAQQAIAKAGHKLAKIEP